MSSSLGLTMADARVPLVSTWSRGVCPDQCTPVQCVTQFCQSGPGNNISQERDDEVIKRRGCIDTKWEGAEKNARERGAFTEKPFMISVAVCILLLCHN